jgi:hypothetical protein
VFRTMPHSKTNLIHVFAFCKFDHERDNCLTDGGVTDVAKSSMKTQSLVNHGLIAGSSFERQLPSKLFPAKRRPAVQSSPEKFIHISEVHDRGS